MDAANDGAGQDARLAAPPPADGFAKLTVGALGVVFGDIGTSPLYALRESFTGTHVLPVDRLHIHGVISLIFWTLMMIVTFKYVLVTMRADNKGEGGSFALLALITRSLGGDRRVGAVALLGVLATALFFGDVIITPAISVLSAVEGLTVVNEGLAPLVLPITVGIIVGLFLIQSRGTARVGAVFGPIVLVYFAALATLGVAGILRHPDILTALNPIWVARFVALDPVRAFLVLGSVVLAVTGAEALYADMGHFGRRPIAVGWLSLVLPALMINYMGQGALLLDDPAAIRNPFFLLAPGWFQPPLVALATLATIIASQAVISGAFSVAQQAVQLGFLPRLRIRHTSAVAAGQIYVPAANWLMMALVIALVLSFGESSDLAAAYGIAVTGTMFITTLMLGVLVVNVWKWNRWVAGLVIGTFLLVDGAYFASNLLKIPEGGWFPLAVAAMGFLLMTTWATGRRLMRARLEESAMPVGLFVGSAARTAARVPGTAVFMAATADGVPPALLHNLKHNRVLHERVALLTIRIEDVPHVARDDRAAVEPLGEGVWRVLLRYGFMDEIDVPAALAGVRTDGAGFKMMETSFFLSRQTLVASQRPGMALWREKLFAAMQRNAESAMEFFKLPTNRVVELGSQVEI